MRSMIIHLKNTWRDLLVVLTAVLVLGSLILVAYGIAQNNRLAAQSKQHIDCIIKDLATPLPKDKHAKYITNLQTDCNIKFTKE